MLYQLMTHFFKKPIENVDALKTQRVETSIFYVFPLIIILGIEVYIYWLHFTIGLIYYSIHWKLQLDGTFSGLLVLALLIMGVYPLLEPRQDISNLWFNNNGGGSW